MFTNTSIHPHVGDMPVGEIKSDNLVSLDLSQRDGLLSIVSRVDQLTADYLRRLADEASKLAAQVQERIDEKERKQLATLDHLRVIEQVSEKGTES